MLTSKHTNFRTERFPTTPFGVIFLLFLFLLPGSRIFAQEKLTMADAILKGRTAFAPGRLDQLQWIPGAKAYSYANGNMVLRVQAKDQITDTLDVLGSINMGLKSLDRSAIAALPAIKWLGPETFRFESAQTVYDADLKGHCTQVNHYPPDAENVDIHAETGNIAYTSGNTLRISIKGREQTLAQSESEGIVYGKSVHRDEFGIYKGTFWSPSGRYLAFYRMDESMVTQYPIYILDSMPAQVRYIRYPFAGSKSHHVTLGIFDTQSGKTIYLQTGEPAEQYLTNIAWTADERSILIAVLNREQNHLWLKQFDATSGAFVKTLFEEQNDKWVEPEHPAVFVPGNPNQFLWQSERDGFNQLYLYNLDGKLIQQVSSGPMPVTEFYGFSKDGKTCYYQVSDDNGMARQSYKALLGGKTSTERLTTQGGTHNLLVDEEGSWFIDVLSDMVHPRRIMIAPVQNPNKRTIIYNAVNPLSSYVIGQTNYVQVKADDGALLNGRLIMPMGYDAQKRYPVIVYVYNGPHVQLVSNSWLAGAEVWMHYMAQEGYAVFTVDGRGSANRGFEFESAVHRHLGDLEVADQLAGVRYLKSLSYIDSTRIGVFGWSYGGFMSTSLMTRPEAAGVFKCGVAGGPVLDWSMYEIMYTERYMDMPLENPEGYEKNSLFNYIDNLNGKLLMIHGTSDDVVLWQHSLRYIRECVRKNKQIDYFVYPEHPHNVRGRDRVNLFEKIELYFKQNL